MNFSVNDESYDKSLIVCINSALLGFYLCHHGICVKRDVFL